MYYLVKKSEIKSKENAEKDKKHLQAIRDHFKIQVARHKAPMAGIQQQQAPHISVIPTASS